MLDFAQAVHWHRNAVAQLLRPLEPAGDRRIVLVDRHRVRRVPDDHRVIVYLLRSPQVLLHHLDESRVVRLKDFPNDRTLDDRAKYVDQLRYRVEEHIQLKMCQIYFDFNSVLT